MKSKGPELFFSQLGGERPIPEEFVAAMERSETRQKVPLEFELSNLEEDENRVEARFDPRYENTNEKWLIQVWKKIGNITLLDIRTDDNGFSVQITRTLFPTGEPPSSVVPDATTQAAIRDLGNGWSIMEVLVQGTYSGTTFVPGVFSGAAYEKELSRGLPPKWLSDIPTTTTRTTTLGTAAAPTLTGDEIRERQEQVTTFTKRTEIVTQAPPVLPIVREGQEYDRRANVTIPFEERLEAEGSSIGDPFTEVNPLGGGYDEAKEYDPSQVATALDAVSIVFPSRTNIQLPDELVNIEVVWNEAQGQGTFDSEWHGHASGTSYSLGGSEGGDAQGSASVMPELVINIKQRWGRNIPTTSYFFFLPLPITEAAFLTKLQTLVGASIDTWPIFKPEQHTIICHGMKISVSARAQGAASVSNSDSGNSWDYSEGEGTSHDTATMNDMVTIPPTIHEFLSFGDSRTTAATAAATAFWNGYNFPSINASASITEDASGFVDPGFLNATSPSEIPTTGFFLLDTKIEPYGYDYAECYGEVLDASNLA